MEPTKLPCRLSLAAVILLITTAAAVAATPVDLEIAIEPGAPVGGSQKWLSVLKELDFSNVRLRSARGEDEPSIESEGSDDRARFRVRGILTAENQLLLPGGSFTASDSAGIRRWLEKVRDGGPDLLAGDVQAFGLSSQQLVDLHEVVARPAKGPFVGERLEVVVARLLESLPYPHSLSATVQAKLRSADPIQDDWDQFTTGTTLAGILRPAGLSWVPERLPGNKIRLTVTETREAEKYWPVGWPPLKPPNSVLPDLFKFLKVEIDDVPLTEALSALQPRLGAPIRLDHAALSRHNIDPATARVSLPAGNTYYKVILERLLAQARLKFELRVDEADRPLLWITTLTGR